MLVIGLTGGIGSGKSTVALFFNELGIPVIDADSIAKALVAPNTEILTQIVQHFGQDIIDAQGCLLRQKLRIKIFSQPEERIWLENLLHPLIWKKIQEQLKQIDAQYCILIIPLLIEKQIPVDRILVVDLPESLQILRAQQRDATTSAEIQNLMQTQISRQERLAKADDILHNEGSLEELKKQVIALHQKYLMLSHSKEKNNDEFIKNQ